MMGFAWPEQTPAPTTQTERPIKTSPQPPPKPKARPIAPQESKAHLVISQQGTKLGFTLSGPQAAPETASQPVPQNNRFVEREENREAPGPIDPLLVPRWTRAILSTAVSRRIHDGPLDIGAVVEMLTKRITIRALPRLSSFSVASSVQLLLDVGDNMLPFADDQRSLLESFMNVVGKDAVEVLKFVGTPLRGAGAHSIDTWLPYRCPLPGTEVILLSDLGLRSPGLGQKPALAQEWFDFAAPLLTRGVRVSAFIPYPRHRWPRGVQRAIRLVEWDRTTTAASIRFANPVGM